MPLVEQIEDCSEQPERRRKTHGNRNGSKWIRRERRLRIYLRDERACLICGAMHDLTLDHYVPRHRGGSNYSTNLITLCMRCNCFKGHKTPRSWFQSLRRYFGGGHEDPVPRVREIIDRIDRHRRRALPPLPAEIVEVSIAISISEET